MLSGLYANWMVAWETALTTRDENRVERPLEWGFQHLADCGGSYAAKQVARQAETPLEAMKELNQRIVADPESFFAYRTPTDFQVEQRFPELHPTNVRPETLEQQREWQRKAEAGELRREPFLRWTSAVRTGIPQNDLANARWYPAQPGTGFVDQRTGRRRRQAIIVMPQWNADAFSHNTLCELFNRWGISCLRLSKPYHDVRRPPELERSDYAVSSNIGRTIAAARQAVVDVRSAVDWLESQGYEQFGVLGTSLGSCYAFLAAAMDQRIEVCAFNHASTWFGDVVWTGQSTRHVRASLEHAGLTREDVREILAGISPMSFMKAYSRSADRHTLVVHASYDLTFLPELSQEVLKSFDEYGIPYVSKVLPCGHYTTGETPYKYLDGWYLGSFVWGAFRRLASQKPLKRRRR
ncbi:MAG TPA: alpha/beta hydrolase family protein [Candidatus Aquilonibacter sp.]|nr:alpha/beta hydrolase family protein [Candidatus Aquilonibacter sp.]